MTLAVTNCLLEQWVILTNNVLTSKISLVIKCHTQYTINLGCVSISFNVVCETKPLGGNIPLL